MVSVTAQETLPAEIAELSQLSTVVLNAQVPTCHVILAFYRHTSTCLYIGLK